MAALLTLKIKMVKTGQRAHLNAVWKMFQDASKTRAEFRLVLPTQGHDMVPGAKQEFIPPMAVKDLPPWTTLHTHTAPGRTHLSPSNDKVQHILVGAPRAGRN